MDEEPQQKKKLPGIIFLIGVIILILFIRFANSNDTPFENVMKGTALELNKTCPLAVNEDIRLDSATVLENKTFRYNYTLLNSNKDSMEVEMFLLSVEPLMLNNAKTNPDLKLFRENEVILEYYFRDGLGNFLTRIEIGPDKYLH